MGQDLSHSDTRSPLSAAHGKAVVVGIYGISGSGKSNLLEQLEKELGGEYFAYYEGSKVIDTIVPGGLDAFKMMAEQDQAHWRGLAIDKIGKMCTDLGKVGIVTGHFMFWSEEEDTGSTVYTERDMQTFSHILYLDFPAKIFAQRRQLDTKRTRPSFSANHLHRWQQTEIAQLRELCRIHGVLFTLISFDRTERVSALLRDFQQHNEEYNTSCATKMLDEALLLDPPHPLETVLVLDADKTLAAEDTGLLFWKNIPRPKDEECPLTKLFSDPLRYSYTAFRQATLLYEEAVGDQQFDNICLNVASAVKMYPEFVSLLQLVAEKQHIGAVVVTCGPRRIWDKILEKEGLSQKVKVIGGGRLSDGFVVTPAVKGALVAHLQDVHQLYVWAFGDSPLDLEMLCQADRAVVVVGEAHARSQSMDGGLISAVDNNHAWLRQALIPSTVPPRLDTTKLPRIQLTDHEFVNSVLSHLNLVDATDRAATKLLMTKMRDATVAGPMLREAHRRAGWYLANEFLADAIGLEEFLIPHVQGHNVAGYRLLQELQTLIVAVMRGGEPMAFGVNDAFPHAMFLHANTHNDITSELLKVRERIILVDSVINSGKSILQFVKHIRSLHTTIHIVIVAGVVQSQSVCRRSPIRMFAHEYGGKLTIVALRLSENKFTGKGTTDTGNRLFNTVHLP
ncbi:uracil phosphoribosyltransferase [Aspergillus avenaceus]|uniref:Uracil phosphoribosyltransferase n=1 Tax=Aspergillus avenaceus TaxID=36643 RepID=A0A5N6TUE7_ASPAV|nr:uracil phosphoribosyltransferase [Aspergillus avenaceus]